MNTTVWFFPIGPSACVIEAPAAFTVLTLLAFLCSFIHKLYKKNLVPAKQLQGRCHWLFDSWRLYSSCLVQKGDHSWLPPGNCCAHLLVKVVLRWFWCGLLLIGGCWAVDTEKYRWISCSLVFVKSCLYLCIFVWSVLFVCLWCDCLLYRLLIGGDWDGLTSGWCVNC